MKKWIQSIGLLALALIPFTLSAQTDIIEINSYGPPRYSGGTIASPNEVFALYHQNLQSSVSEVNTTRIENVYPNPATSTVQIILETVPVGKTALFVFNTNGVMERSFEFAPGSARISLDVSSLPPGIYSLQIQEEGKEAQSVQLSKY